MRTQASDLEKISALLDRELKNGNDWVVYGNSTELAENNMKFFELHIDAIDHALENQMPLDTTRVYPIDKLQELFAELIFNRSIYDSDGKVYNIELNDDISAIQNAESLVRELSVFGIESLPAERLLEHFRNNPFEFKETVQTLFGEDKIKYDLVFHNRADGHYKDRYRFRDFTATLYPAMAVPHIEINGIKISDLELKMKEADWYHEYSDDARVWSAGRETISSIGEDLKKLSQDDEGLRIATILWNNYVPYYSFGKPDFIEAYEQNSQIYPSVEFPRDHKIDAEDAFELIKERYESSKYDLAISSENEQLRFQLLDLSGGKLHNQRSKEFLIPSLLFGSSERLNALSLPTSENEIELYYTISQRSSIENKTNLESITTTHAFLKLDDALKDFHELVSIPLTEVESHKLMLIGKYDNDGAVLGLDGEVDPSKALTVASVVFEPGYQQMFKPPDTIKGNYPYQDKFAPSYVYMEFNREKNEFNFYDAFHEPLQFTINPKSNLAALQVELKEISKQFDLDITSLELRNQLNLKYMNQEQLSNPQKALLYKGFPETMYTELDKKIKEGQPQFTIPHHEKTKDKETDAMTYWKQGKEAGSAFFNKFDVTVTKPTGEQESGTFYLNQGKGPTLKQAENYLDGRFMLSQFTKKATQEGDTFQPGEAYMAWRRADLTKEKDEKGHRPYEQVHESYGYDVLKALKKYPILELAAQEDGLKKSLEKGNLQAVSFNLPEGVVRRYVSADPQGRDLKIYDNNMRLLIPEEKYAQSVKGIAARTSQTNSEQPEKEIKPNQQVNPTSVNTGIKGEEKKENKNENLAAGEKLKPGEKKNLTAGGKNVKNLLPQKEGTGKKKTQKIK